MADPPETLADLSARIRRLEQRILGLYREHSAWRTCDVPATRDVRQE